MFQSDPFTLAFGARQPAFLPPADVTVSENDVVLTMDVPGLRVEDLDIQLLDGHLTVRGERRRPELSGDGSWVHAERAFGRFERRIKLPDGVDGDRIAASLVDGVLALIVPKPERMQPRQITIGAQEQQRSLETASA